MRAFGRHAALLVLLMLTTVSIVYAQSVTLSPTMPSVGLGQTIQFSAQTTGLTSNDVVWFSGGVKGGNSTAGTITTTGLYQAPTIMPAQNPVQIIAKSAVNSTIKATTYVVLLTVAPMITSVSPNPLSVGTITVTIAGTGFLPNAVVLETYGTNTGIQLSTVSVTSNTVVATGYQGPAATGSFSVRNPGSTSSNVLTVPIASATSDLKYTLNVVNGSGSGSYKAGTVVTIKAYEPPAGQTFVNWTGASVQNATAATTTLTMPAVNKTVTANYSGATTPKYTLSVVNGSGGGSYAAGTVVNIAANAAPAGQTFANWTGASVQNANASSTTLTMPAANTTVTANYSGTPPPTQYTLTVVNGTGSGSYTAGTLVTIKANTAPAGQAFVNWTGAAVQNASASTTDLTMPTGNTTVTANYAVSTPVTIPYPVSTHPRLWITPNDLPHLQSWATASNPVYAQGIVPLLNQAVNNYNTQFFPGGVANPNFPDLGDTNGYDIYVTEENGLVLAFNSLIDPSPTSRIKYAQYAHNLMMYVMNQAVLGHQTNTPWRDPLFAVYNRGNFSGMEWPLIVDWIYNAKDGQGNAILTASDKQTIRNVFMMWANDCLNAYTTGGDHPAPIGVMNDPTQLLAGNKPYRMAMNNYYLGHARLLTMMALSLDPGDDPLVNPSAPASQVGNTLRSYILDANGAWLYQEFAMMGDPSTVANSYNLPGNGTGFGLASGGLPPEGMLYGHSYSFILGQLLALQTAGFHNTSYSGPQINLIDSPVWDRFVTGFIASLTPTAQTPPSQTYLGPVYGFGSYGDLLRLWVTPDFMQPFALLALLEQQNGKTTHLDTARWFAVNVPEGGPGFLMNRISSPWSYGTPSSILYYMLLDPAAPAGTDPRPTYPTTFVDAPAGRIVAHSNWGSNNTLFDYRASWISINHQVGDAGQFELYRNGEWLTKEMSNYDNNAQGLTSKYHNTLALQNYSVNGTPNLQWYEQGEWLNGSQWMLGLSAGDPTTVTSSGPGYVYANSDLTNLYNHPNFWTPAAGATNITQATRSIVWLNNDYIVIYDRATSLNNGLFKRFNLSLVTNPTITGNVATETMASGQKLFMQTLLPQNPSISSTYAAGGLNPIAQLEPTQYILTTEDASKPSDTRFLHVLQAADPGTPMDAATRLQSTSGTTFDGAVFGSSAVYFPVSATVAFTGMTVSVPSGVHTVLITGLAANASYGASVQSSAFGTTITITTGGVETTTDAAGLMKLTF